MGIELTGVPRFYVLTMTTRYRSFAEAQAAAPGDLAAHVARSRELHAQGVLLMAGAFLDGDDEPLRTMGILRTEEEARAYAEGDPFVRAGMVEEWRVRPWANLFA
jgi:uncharacterized protein YciI